MIYLNNQPLKFKKFPNGETNFERSLISDNVAKDNKKDIVTLKYESDADLFQLLLVRKAIWFPVDLHITYFPYSRMDRISESHIFTLKSIAKFINWLEFDRVYIYEPHSDVTPALLNKCKIISIIPKLLRKTDFDIEKDFVLYPDAGAEKKYSDIIKATNQLVGIKQRDFKTGKIKKIQILGELHALRDKNVYIIDDLCSKGGTFILAAQQLKKLGAKKIFLVVAHCEETIIQGKIFTTDLIDKVFTTDSILRSISNTKLVVFSLRELFGICTTLR